MSYDIDVASVKQYSTNIELLLQQKGSVLRNCVTNARYKGKAAKAIEQIGAVSASKVTTRHSDTPLFSTPHSARWVFPKDYIWADLIDDEDKLRMIIDPTSSYSVNGSYAIGRAMDDEIMDAFFATSQIGENGAGNIEFNNKNIVDIKNNQGEKTGLTIDKLRSAKKILRQHEVDLDHDPVYCAITAQQEQDLLAQTQLISLDYNTKPVLADGKLTSFMGVNFVNIQRLPLDKQNVRYCPVWSKSGMHLGIWNDISVSVDKRTDKRNATQIMVKATFGATRSDENKVVKILCNEG